MRKSLWVNLVAVLLALPASADIYKWVDAGGRVHLSNLQPEWWLEEYADRSYLEIVAPAASPRVEMSDEELAQTYEFVADAKTRLYHSFDCSGVTRREGERLVLTIPIERRAFFHSAYGARRAGFSPDPECRSPTDPAEPPETAPPEGTGEPPVRRGEEALYRTNGEPDLETPDYGQGQAAEKPEERLAREKEMEMQKEKEAKLAEEKRLEEEKRLAEEKERQAKEEEGAE